jgi:hypothetical protein
MATEKRLIDVDVAIERAKASDNIVGSSTWETDEVVEFLEDEPIVDAVEVVHGRWIIEDADSGEHGCYEAYMIVECSHCGQSHEVETGQFGWVYGDPFPFNYCPNCGADMRERKGNGAE